jgi:hypothetical protein
MSKEVRKLVTRKDIKKFPLLSTAFALRQSTALMLLMPALLTSFTKDDHEPH